VKIVTIDCHAVVRFRGRMRSGRTSDQLEACVRRLHAALVAAHSKSITVDVRDLVWAHESAVRALVAWAMWIEHDCAERRYKMSFLIDPTSLWQKATFEALRSVAPNVVEQGVAD
jgi:phosphatidylserine/phosphatidylglycerophosphate/cardiolipin synthase-like enzyme